MPETGSIPNEGDAAADQHYDKGNGAHDSHDGADTFDQFHDPGQWILPAHGGYKQSSRPGVFMSASRRHSSRSVDGSDALRTTGKDSTHPFHVRLAALASVANVLT